VAVLISAGTLTVLTEDFVFFLTHLASYPVGTAGVKRPGREADHSPPSAEVNNGEAIPPLLNISS
jgi:hypothetical protein